MKLKNTAFASSSIIDTTTILLYKESLSLLEKLNFENDKTFSEPPLNAALPFALIQLFLICFWLYISTNPNLGIFVTIAL